MHSPHSDGQSGHPYPEEVAHTHHAPYLMPTSVEYIQAVKTSAYHTNVPYNIQPNPSGLQTSVKTRGWEGEGRGKESVWRGVGGGKVREYEGWEGERKEVGAEGDGRRGVGKGDGEEVLYAITCSYTLLVQKQHTKSHDNSCSSLNRSYMKALVWVVTV